MVSEIFSRVVPSFHGRKTDNFHGQTKFFYGEKNTEVSEQLMFKILVFVKFLDRLLFLAKKGGYEYYSNFFL